MVAIHSSIIDKYNGKEMDRMYGLDTYDHGARQYNPARITWDRMDKLCEKYYHINPYVYCAGNPVMFIDPDGREWGENELENGQNIIYVNVELINNIKNLSLEEIEEYKNAVSQTFKQMVSAASNGEYVAQINFNAPQEEGQLHLQMTWEESGNQASVAGKTFGNISITYLCGPTGDIKNKDAFAYDNIHELLHTLRMPELVEKHNISDAQVENIGIKHWKSIGSAYPNLYANVMAYPTHFVDGKSIYTDATPPKQNITPGQFMFMRQNIALQRQGAWKSSNYYLE